MSDANKPLDDKELAKFPKEKLAGLSAEELAKLSELKPGALSDEELENVAGGCGGTKSTPTPRFHPGDHVFFGIIGTGGIGGKGIVMNEIAGTADSTGYGRMYYVRRDGNRELVTVFESVMKKI